jgi:hypothetical protein
MGSLLDKETKEYVSQTPMTKETYFEEVKETKKNTRPMTADEFAALMKERRDSFSNDKVM